MRGRYILMLAALLSCVSCLKDDNSYKTPQAAITSFTIGYYNVKFHDMNIHGRDTLVNIREGGIMYPMSIDQVNNRIFNVDSMAYGSDLSGVTTTVYGNGTIGYRYMDDPMVKYLWRSQDSIDFTRKVQFVAVRNDSVFCFGTDTLGAPTVSFRSVTGGNWTGANAMAGITGTDWSHRVTVCNGKFYTVSANSLYASSDALNWSQVKSGIKSLIVSVDDYGMLWAVSQDSNLVKSSDMTDWTTVQRVPENFPDSAAYIMTYPLATNASLTRSVIAGLGSDSLSASVWTILTGDTVWTKVDVPADKNLRLPASASLSLIRYDGAVYGLGQGLDGFRQSNDNGITWY